MILSKVTIKNVKAYRGEHVLELPRPTRERPIHLIGAPNGYGKTTLFEAIKGCFFATGNDPILRANYISRNISDENITEMAVEIEFEHEAQQFRLSRRWVPRASRDSSNVGSVVVHSLMQNLSTDESSRDEDEISDFVNGIFPLEINHFFLFDGEQVQEYIDSTAQNVRDALERLLGLSTYLQLLDDLRIVEGQIRHDRQSFDVGADLNRKLERIDNIDARLVAIGRNRSEIGRSATESGRRMRALGLEETKYSEAANPELQSRRRELESARDFVKHDLDMKEQRVAELVSKDIGLVWFWPLLHEANIRHREDLTSGSLPNTIDQFADFLIENRDSIIRGLKDGDKLQIKTILEAALGLSLEQKSLNNISLGIKELSAIVGNAKSDILSLLDQLGNTNSEHTRLMHEIEGLPRPETTNVDIQQLHQKMSDERTILARHQSAIQQLSVEEDQLKNESVEIKADVNRLTSNRTRFRNLTEQMELCRRLWESLENFVRDYRSTRIEDLERVLNEKFKRLTNLPEILDRVEIDRDNFEIKIKLRSTAAIDADEQSAGQKEVLAFALISSVVELSNQSLPAVIDTPLARLDMKHKSNVLTKFFPFIGPQVLILATDTEIGIAERIKLAPHIISEHHLERDVKTESTSIVEGYLFD